MVLAVIVASHTALIMSCANNGWYILGVHALHSNRIQTGRSFN